MTVDEIYTPLEEAKKEIWKRWNDKELRKKVLEFIGGNENLPDYFFEKPHAISIEDVATPNLYFWTFMNKAYLADLEPLHFEYHDDMFITTNYDKASLGKMVFYHGLDDNKQMIKSIERIIDLSGCEEKKKIKDIKTFHGQSLVDFHHNILLKNFPDAKIFDGSKWFISKGGCANRYYKYVLAMSICYGVLFENFLDYEYEHELVENILFPSFKEITQIFGVRPLIVPVAPTDGVLEKYWWAYPEFIKVMLKDQK